MRALAIVGAALGLCAASSEPGPDADRLSATTTYQYGEETITIPDPAALLPASACGAVENHTVYMGHDVGGDPNPGQNVETLEDCCALCNGNAQCRFVTYNAPVCYLKTSDAGRSSRPTGPQISASRTAPVPPAPPPTPPYSGSLPNLVFLIVESTDGRTYHEDSDAYIPNIRGLQRRGSYFKNFCEAPRSLRMRHTASSASRFPLLPCRQQLARLRGLALGHLERAARAPHPALQPGRQGQRRLEQRRRQRAGLLEGLGRRARIPGHGAELQLEPRERGQRQGLRELLLRQDRLDRRRPRALELAAVLDDVRRYPV